VGVQPNLHRRPLKRNAREEPDEALKEIVVGFTRLSRGIEELRNLVQRLPRTDEPPFGDVRSHENPVRYLLSVSTIVQQEKCICGECLFHHRSHDRAILSTTSPIGDGNGEAQENERRGQQNDDIEPR